MERVRQHFRYLTGCREVNEDTAGCGCSPLPEKNSVRTNKKAVSRSAFSPWLLLVCAVATGCGPRLTADVVTESVLKTAPFDGALAVLVPQTLSAPCDKLPANQEAHAWGVMISSGFMQKSATTSGDGAAQCALALTERGAQRKSFGRIVREGTSWRIPVGGIGTDLPEYKKSVQGETATVSFGWQFYRFRGVEGLLVLDKLPQSNKSLRAVDVPPRGIASATFRRHGEIWELEGVRLAQ
jgi:hypothetical protein